MKAVSETLGVARSNLIERRDGKRPPRGPQNRVGDGELAGTIRALVDARPTYGYRRIAALLRRERRANGLAQVNAKRVYRLMKKHGLLLERHTGRRRPREHDGQVVTIRSNCRWCADALEFTCWNGEVVRVAFALDCHDREVISWTATTAGISGEMIRDMISARRVVRIGVEDLGLVSDPASDIGSRRRAEQVHAPCIRSQESQDGRNRRRLAGAVRPDERHDRAARHAERDVTHGVHRRAPDAGAIRLGQPLDVDDRFEHGQSVAEWLVVGSLWLMIDY